jgi:hypothetical protein
MTAISKQLDELKRWSQMPANKQMLNTISFNFQTSFCDQLARTFINVDLKSTVEDLKMYF